MEYPTLLLAILFGSFIPTLCSTLLNYCSSFLFVLIFLRRVIFNESGRQLHTQSSPGERSGNFSQNGKFGQNGKLARMVCWSER